MTVVGKILVFVNLVFSLLTAGLIIMVYTTRTNWRDANNKLRDGMQVVQAQAAAERETKDRDLAERDKQIQTLTVQKQAEDKARQDDADKMKGLQARISELEQTLAKGGQNNTDLTNELNRRKQEVENLNKIAQAREQKISEIDRQMDKLRQEAVQARVEAGQARERSELMQRQIETLTRENAQLRQSGASPTRPQQGQPTTVQKPTEDIRGTIQQVTSDGLARMTPGSDAGVKVGDVLQIFRTQPKAEYLGTIQILQATPHEAVGRLQGAKRGQVKAGDTVAADILGGGR
jgi:hypothetical protein